MTRIEGRSRAEVEPTEDRFVGLLVGGLRDVTDATARVLGATESGSESAVAVSTADINSLTTAWLRFVDDGGPLTFLAGVYDATRERLTRGIAHAVRVPPTVIPRTSTVAQEAYLSRARNRLRGLADDLWVRTRESLIEGIRRGEGIKELRDRVREGANLTRARAEAIARTEVQDAVVGAEYDQLRVTGLVATKEWLATNDTRTRDSHRHVDGTTIPLTEVFTVGGSPMRRPLDPNGPPGEVVNCRCTLVYDVADDELQQLTAAAPLVTGSDTPTGAMIALVPTSDDAGRLALDGDVEGAEADDELHLTLWFLGDASDVVERGHRDGIVNHVTSAVENLPRETLTKRVFGVNHWNLTGDEPSWVLAVEDDRDDPDTLSLSDVREAVSPRRYTFADELTVPIQHSPWIPHVCVAYTSDELPSDVGPERMGPITFDRVRVSFGSDVTDIPLRRPDTVAPDVQPGGDEE